MTIAIGVNGACGRMGRRVIDVAHADPEVTVAAAVDSPGHPLQGRDAGEVAGVGPLGLKVTSELPPTPVDVLIDFSSPVGTMTVLPACVQRKVPLVLATTGHPPEDRTAIAKAALEIPVLYVP
ncbi:MAG TPA: 4-hydroxy-tetrahydrodipicolinate reductase, partial [Gemmataceae bacterium]|nr:4-hydroxy-tetrahydrodipicolinate reductase [Gemmataceae bacterium]